MEAWREDSVGNLYTRVRNLMPFDEPATLSDAAYLDSVAYLLQVNGFPAGPRELTAAGAADIRIEDEDGPGEVPSFALVRVVGCLARGRRYRLGADRGHPRGPNRGIRPNRAPRRWPPLPMSRSGPGRSS